MKGSGEARNGALWSSSLTFELTDPTLTFCHDPTQQPHRTLYTTYGLFSLRPARAASARTTRPIRPPAYPETRNPAATSVGLPISSLGHCGRPIIRCRPGPTTSPRAFRSLRGRSRTRPGPAPYPQRRAPSPIPAVAVAGGGGGQRADIDGDNKHGSISESNVKRAGAYDRQDGLATMRSIRSAGRPLSKPRKHGADIQPQYTIAMSTMTP